MKTYLLRACWAKVGLEHVGCQQQAEGNCWPMSLCFWQLYSELDLPWSKHLMSGKRTLGVVDRWTLLGCWSDCGTSNLSQFTDCNLRCFWHKCFSKTIPANTSKNTILKCILQCSSAQSAFRNHPKTPWRFGICPAKIGSFFRPFACGGFKSVAHPWILSCLNRASKTRHETQRCFNNR